MIELFHFFGLFLLVVRFSLVIVFLHVGFNALAGFQSRFLILIFVDITVRGDVIYFPLAVFTDRV